MIILRSSIVIFQNEEQQQRNAIYSPAAPEIVQPTDDVDNINNIESHDVEPTDDVDNTNNIDSHECHEVTSCSNVYSDLTFTVSLTWEEFEAIYPANVTSARLSGEWTQLLYTKFHLVWPTCSIIFTTNHVRRQNSRKKNTRFICARAVCKVPGCCSVLFVLPKQPVAGENVVFTVQVNKHCTHHVNTADATGSTAAGKNADVIHKRPLSGEAKLMI